MVKAKFFVEFLRVFAGFLLAVRDLDEKVGVLFSELEVLKVGMEVFGVQDELVMGKFRIRELLYRVGL